MRQLAIVLFGVVILSSCITTIPLQSNLSDQTMLMAENRNIKANYTLRSEIHDGHIPYVSVMKNGSETIDNTSHKYASETAFKKLWDSYIASKFNSYATDQMGIQVTLKELKLKQQAATSIGMTMLTGNTKVNVDAIAVVHVLVDYNGHQYENQFEVTASEYNESQNMQAGSLYYTVNETNPTQQKSKLLESCLNKSVIYFENFLRSVMLADKERVL